MLVACAFDDNHRTFLVDWHLYWLEGSTQAHQASIDNKFIAKVSFFTWQIEEIS
jgi:hypothetical protein